MRGAQPLSQRTSARDAAARQRCLPRRCSAPRQQAEADQIRELTLPLIRVWSRDLGGPLPRQTHPCAVSSRVTQCAVDSALRGEISPILSGCSELYSVSLFLRPKSTVTLNISPALSRISTQSSRVRAQRSQPARAGDGVTCPTAHICAEVGHVARGDHGPSFAISAWPRSSTDTHHPLRSPVATVRRPQSSV